jgi:hypothetical protein
MVEEGLEFSRSLLSWLPPEAQTVLSLPVLIVLMLLALTWLVRLFPAIDRMLGPVGSALATGLGLLLVLPEFLATRALRAGGRRPPGLFHTYGEGIENLVFMGHRASRAGLSGFTTQKRTRRGLIVTVLVAIIVISNSHACPPGPVRCTTPVVAWWNETKVIFKNTGQPTPKPIPKPTSKPSRKPTKKPG